MTSPPSGAGGPPVAIVDVDRAAGASGTVVVLDVIRAFTTACAAMAAGATSITCVEGLGEARQLRRAIGGAVLMGEERGLRPDGFDLGNEPDGPTPALVEGRPVVQRTSNGTRGLVRAAGAPRLLAGAAVNVGATAAWITCHAPTDPVTVVTTGWTSEDAVVARYLAELLAGGRPDRAATAAAVRAARDDHAALFSRPRSDREMEAFRADVERCSLVDCRPFALVATLSAETGAPVLRAETPDGAPWRAPRGGQRR